MKKIAVLFSGKGSNFAHIVKSLQRDEIEVVVALTNNPNAEGIVIAKKYAIPLEVIDPKSYQNRESFDTVVVNTLQAYTPDLTVLAGFMRILTPVFTDNVKSVNLHPSLLPRHKGLNSVNLHPSLLPRHKGLNAIEKSYKDEYPSGGISVHYVSSELDGGEILLQKEVSKEGLTFEEYDKKIRSIEKEVLIEAIHKVLGK
jgi:phosphoribosylglycinamide formyltransferase-1